jgi:hypothetical protein
VTREHDRLDAVRGEAKAYSQYLPTAAAINVVRLSEWWAGRRYPGAVARDSPRCNRPRE